MQKCIVKPITGFIFVFGLSIILTSCEFLQLRKMAAKKEVELKVKMDSLNTEKEKIDYELNLVESELKNRKELDSSSSSNYTLK
jgi:hypothetical protein